jgi:polysaccharide export outer membrane protein
MVLRLDKFGRSGAALLVGLVLGWTAGCASDDSLVLPPGGLLDEAIHGWNPAEEAPPPTRKEAAAQKAADRAARKEAARAAAQAKKNAAAEAKRAAAAEQAATPKDPPAEIAPSDEKAQAPGTDGPSGSAAEHVLQIGDEIDIQVYREPELSGAFKINPAGEIRHSLAGAIPLAGKTVAEAEAVFTRILAKDYLVNPRVIFKLLSTQSSQIVLMGEVKKPGVYPLPFGETMTLLQAIASAGGFTELASPDRVRIVRRRPDGGQTTLRVRVSNLLKSRDGQNDVPLQPNDVIMVDQVFF